MEDPYPSIGDYGLIGDCHSAALVSRRASIDWCCLPRFDSGSAFARLLDWDQGGLSSITPTAPGDWQHERVYLDDTLVLQTTVEGPAGQATITDCFLAGDERSTTHRQILRVVDGRRGSVEFEVRVAGKGEIAGGMRHTEVSSGLKLVQGSLKTAGVGGV